MATEITTAQRTWITVYDVALRLHISQQRARKLCPRITGAQFVGASRRGVWIIQSDFEDPRKPAGRPKKPVEVQP